jgi:Ca2+-binding RTX toxin-like protein
MELSGAAVDEGVSGGVIGTLTAFDPDSSAIMFDALDERFEVVGNQLKLRDGASLDYEEEPTVTIRVKATDSHGAATTQSFMIAVRDVAEGPADISLSNMTNTVAENRDMTGRLKVADIAGAGIAGALALSGADAGAFEIDGNALYLKAGTALDYESKNAYAVSITATVGGHTSSEYYTLALTNVNEAPFDIAIVAGGFVLENAVAGTVVAKLKTIDPDYGDNPILSLDGPSAALFEVDGEQIKVRQGAVIDFENAAAHDLLVTARDSHGLIYTKSIAINVHDLPDTDDGPPVSQPPVSQPPVDQPPAPVPPVDQPPAPPVGEPPVAGLECHGGSGHDRLWGGAGDDRMWGGAGHDRFHGGQGADLMWGGRGNDTFYVDQAGDRVHESRGQGTDTVHASVSYSLAGTHVEKLVLTGAADLSATGNSLANTLTGNSGHNLLKGGAGHDVLKGNAGNDQLHGGSGHDRLNGGSGDDLLKGGSGHDRLTGGSGRDTFVFEKRGGHDTVTDFRHGHDRIDVSQLSGVDDLGDLARVQVGRDTVIWHNQDVLVLKGVSAAELDQSDFIF